MKSLPSLAPRGFTIAFIVLCLFGLMGASPAHAQDQAAIEKVTDLNKRALDSYMDGDFAKARTLLKQALDVCASSGLDQHAIAARTHIHMGVVLTGGFNQKDLAIKQFRKALDLEPGIQVTKNVATPEVEAVFKEAQSAAPGSSDGAAPPPAGGEGDADKDSGPPPAAPSSGLIHLPVKKSQPGAPIAIVARVNSPVDKVMLSFKSDDAEEFTAKGLMKSGSRFQGQIPASATGGKKVSYFLEAQDAEGTVLSSVGSESKPLVVSLGGKDCGDNEDCDEEEGPAGPPIFIGILGGIGVGYTTGHSDLTEANKVINGFAPSSAFHIAPEFGYFISADWRLSLQGRIQFVSGPTPLVDGSGTHQPAKTGIAALLRSSWFFGSGSLRPYVLAALGGGQIRHVVVFDKAQRICGANGDQKCVDTVTAGPLLVGGGAGLAIAFTDNVGAIIEMNALLGAPKFTAHFDFNGGLSLRF